MASPGPRGARRCRRPPRAVRTYSAISSSSAGELVDADLPGARLLGQVAERHRDVEQVLDAREQRERGLGARRLRDVVRHRRPQRHRRDARLRRRRPAARRRCRSVPRTSTARSRARRAMPSSLDVPLTGTGRVCGLSASSAPRVTTISTPRSRAAPSSSWVKVRQRIDGSMPWTRTTSRVASGMRATESRVVGQVIVRTPSSIDDLGAVDLEVVVVLGVELGDLRRRPRPPRGAAPRRWPRRRRRSSPRTRRASPGRRGRAARRAGPRTRSPGHPSVLGPAPCRPTVGEVARHRTPASERPR